MVYGLFATLLGRKENQQLVSVDIGSSAVKLMELEVFPGPRYRLMSVGSAPCPAGAVNNNSVVKPDAVAAQIRSIMDAHEMKSTVAAVSIPGPCAFTKKINMGLTSLRELEENIMFEAANYIPHKIDAVRLDFQVLNTNGRNGMEVLLVAVKNEVVQGYLDAVEQAGLTPTILDVDYYALENMFEFNYPEDQNKTVAIVDLGSRFAAVNILQDGRSIFTGDINIGSRYINDQLVERLGVDQTESEQIKVGNIPERFSKETVGEVIDQASSHIASELQRQLGFLWNASATDKSIEEIFICGGGAQLPGFLDQLKEKVGINCRILESFRKVEIGDSFDREYLSEISPTMGVSVGLAMRRRGDKQHAIA